jgi:hypothetical protein
MIDFFTHKVFKIPEEFLQFDVLQVNPKNKENPYVITNNFTRC